MCFKLNCLSFEQDVAQSRTANNVLDILNSDFHDRSISKYRHRNGDSVRRCAVIDCYTNISSLKKARVGHHQGVDDPKEFIQA
jgi:hypothetical protein